MAGVRESRGIKTEESETFCHEVITRACVSHSSEEKKAKAELFLPNTLLHVKMMLPGCFAVA